MTTSIKTNKAGRPKGSKKEDTLAKILPASRRLFAEKGYAQTTFKLVGQAVGRWGNFFNQELYGPPTDLPWGIPIDEAHRPLAYLSETHFQPLFLYESILSAIGVAVLLYLGRRFARRMIVGDMMLLYFIWYGAERFGLEFLRSGNWKVGAIPTAQIVGILLITISVSLLVWRHKRRHTTELPGDEARPRGPSRTAERRRRRRSEPQSND